MRIAPPSPRTIIKNTRKCPQNALSLSQHRRGRGGVVTTEDLEGGFVFEAGRVRFWNPRKGIWRPRQLGNGPALPVMTAPPRAGREPPYDHQVGSDADWLVSGAHSGRS